MNKRLLIGLVGLVVAGLVGTGGFVQADLMDTIFQPSKNLDQVINIGNNPRSVGNSVFRGSTTLTLNGIENTPSLLVRITQTLLRFAIIIAIPLLIYVGVKIIAGTLRGKSLREGLKEVSSILIGLAIALSAVGIIYLIQSLVTRSLVAI